LVARPRLAFGALALAASLAAGATALTAAPTEALSLEEAIQQALRGSPRLAASAADAASAHQRALGASWGRLPRVDLELSALRSDNPVYVFGGLLNQEQFTQNDFGSVDFQTGAFDLTPLNQPDPHSNVRAAVTVNQVLWSGGRVTGRLDAARAMAHAAAEGRERAADQVVFQTEQAFRHALLAEQQLDLLRGTLKVAEAHAARVDALWEEGLALRADRQSLKAHVEEVRARLQNARADSIEARSLLALSMGLDEPVAEPLIASPDDPAAGPTLAEALESAPRRADIRAARAGLSAARAGQKATRSQLFPSLQLMLGAEHNSEDFLGEGGNQWMVALGARMQLDAGIPAKLQSAAAQETAAHKQWEAAREGAVHQVRTAYARWQAALARVEAFQRAVEASAEAFRLTEERNREGLATTLELTEAQNTLTRTRLGAAAARSDAFIARAGLRFAAGRRHDLETSR